MNPACTLAEFFNHTFAPMFCIEAKPRTLREYRFTLNLWRRLTKDPNLADLSIETLAEFRQQLAIGRSPATVNKHLRHINAILAKAGPAGPRNRDALGLLDAVPWVKPLKTLRKLPRRVDAELINRMYEACRFAQAPRAQATAWWRCLLVMAYTTGFRKSALLELTWSNIDITTKTVRLPAQFDKAGCERSKPLCASAIRHLLAIRSGAKHILNWPYSEKKYYAQWHRIQNMADIEPEQRFGLHDLKRTAGSAIAESGNPWVVQMFLDHSSIKTSQHYINASRQLRPAVEALVLPTSFSKE